MIGIQSIETVLLDLPMIRPHLLAMTVMRKRTLLLVRVMCSDAIEGWGEATSIGGLAYGDESPEGVKLCIDTFITPAIHGIDATNINAAMELIGRVVQGNPFREGRDRNGAARRPRQTACGERLGVAGRFGTRHAAGTLDAGERRYAARYRRSGGDARVAPSPRFQIETRAQVREGGSGPRAPASSERSANAPA